MGCQRIGIWVPNVPYSYRRWAPSPTVHSETVKEQIIVVLYLSQPEYNWILLLYFAMLLLLKGRLSYFAFVNVVKCIRDNRKEAKLFNQV